MGVITAHYGVEGNGFYGIPLASILPYTVDAHLARAARPVLDRDRVAGGGLYIVPAVSGKEPQWQRAGVNVLFGALLLVVVGSLAGQWLSVKQMLSETMWFYFGHSGYEYIDLGRLWQIALLVGLLLWLAADGARRFCPALKRRDEQQSILTLFLIAQHRDRRILRRRARLRPAHESCDRRVLAVVGRAPLGRRILRGVRHRRHRLPVRPPEARSAAHGRRGARCCPRRSSSRAASSARCTTSTSPARRRSCWRSARCSARWRSSRSSSSASKPGRT